LENRQYDVIQFRNGYAEEALEMLVEILGLRRYSRAGAVIGCIQLGVPVWLLPPPELNHRCSTPIPLVDIDGEYHTGSE
jgi:hypothetical protein